MQETRCPARSQQSLMASRLRWQRQTEMRWPQPQKTGTWIQGSKPSSEFTVQAENFSAGDNIGLPCKTLHTVSTDLFVFFMKPGHLIAQERDALQYVGEESAERSNLGPQGRPVGTTARWVPAAGDCRKEQGKECLLSDRPGSLLAGKASLGCATALAVSHKLH